MTKSMKSASLAATAGIAVLILSGCTGSLFANPAPTASHTLASSPQPSASPSGAAPPFTENDAWLAATKTITQFLSVQYQIEHEVGAHPERIGPYASEQALDGVNQVAAGLSEKGIRATGKPAWSPSAAATTFGTLLPPDGSSIANGIAYVKGCYDVSKQTASYADGSPAPVSTTRIFPVLFNVKYVPEENTWKVSDSESILGQVGAPKC
jgi:hypothetical protein